MTTITFKVTEEEARKLRERARESRLSVSEFVRRKLSGPPEKRARPLLQRCRHTGAMIFAPHPDYPQLTTESVKEMLADFP